MENSNEECSPAVMKSKMSPTNNNPEDENGLELKTLLAIHRLISAPSSDRNFLPISPKNKENTIFVFLI